MVERPGSKPISRRRVDTQRSSAEASADSDPALTSGVSERTGYCSPPKHSQFKPGISGNPRGRPKVPQSLGAAVDAFLSEKVTVTEQGHIQKFAKRDVIAKQLVNKAASGDLAAIRFLTQVLEANALAKTKQAPGSDNLATSETDEAVIAALVKRFGGSTS